MNAEIICVGTELLLGDVVNTNASDIARGLAHMGINVYHHEVVGDNPQRLQECLRDSLSRCDLVLLTGGLGPTYDDLTKETVAAHFGRGLAMDEESLHTIERYFARTGRKMTENNRKQAMMPEGCIILQNPNGTAPGCIIEGENGKTAVMMPGPPREMRPMFEGPVTDYLMRRTHDGMLVSRTINFFGVGESELEARLRERNDNRRHVSYGCLRLDTVSLTGFVNGQDIQLTQKEFTVLLLLAQNAERRVPSSELAREVWGDGADQENSALWTLVSRLRKKLRSEESRLEIASLRGGYLLEQL